MAGLFGKIKNAAKKATEFVSPPIALYNQHKKQKGKAKRRGKKAQKEQKAHRKDIGKQNKLSYQDQVRYNKELNRQQQNENQRLDKFYNKYGGESFQKFNALNKGQRGTLDEMLRQGKKGLKNMRTPEDFKRVQEERLGRKGGRALENLLENPSITDLRDYGPFQQGQESVQDLLSNNPEAFERFAAPEMRRYNEQTIPGLIGRFGAGGQNNSALNSALANSGADLNERLGALRAGLQSEGRNQALQYGQGIQQGEAAQAGITGKAAQTAPNYLDLYLKQQGLQGENILQQNKQAGSLAQAGLQTNPYHAVYRGPTAPTGYNVTGGVQPAQRYPGQAPLPQQPTKPSYLQQIASNVIPAASTAAGAAFGGPAGAAAGNVFGNFFGGT